MIEQHFEQYYWFTMMAYTLTDQEKKSLFAFPNISEFWLHLRMGKVRFYWPPSFCFISEQKKLFLKKVVSKKGFYFAITALIHLFKV